MTSAFEGFWRPPPRKADGLGVVLLLDLQFGAREFRRAALGSPGTRPGTVLQ